MINVKDIEEFCDHLKKSLIDAYTNNHTHVWYQVKNDISTFTGTTYAYGTKPDDEVWYGCTITICIGRPAVNKNLEKETNND